MGVIKGRRSTGSIHPGRKSSSKAIGGIQNKPISVQTRTEQNIRKNVKKGKLR